MSYWSDKPLSLGATLAPIVDGIHDYRSHIRTKIALSKANLKGLDVVIKPLYPLTDIDTMRDVIRFLRTHYKNEVNPQYQMAYTEHHIRGFFAGAPAHHAMCIGAYCNGQMIGVICGVLKELVYRDKVFLTVMTNFLCIHMDYREVRLAPYMIDELCYYSSVQCNVATTGFFTCSHPVNKYFVDELQYAHRLLDTPYLQKVGYVGEVDTKYIQTVAEPTHAAFQQARDECQIHSKLSTYLHDNYDLSVKWTLEDITSFLKNPMFEVLMTNHCKDVLVCYTVDYVTPQGALITNVYLYTWAFEHHTPEHISSIMDSFVSYLQKNKTGHVLTFLTSLPCTLEDLKALSGAHTYYFFYNVGVPKQARFKNAIVNI